MKKVTLFVLAILSTWSFKTHATMQIVPLLKTADGHLQILASINNVEAKFVLDTGATGTVIDINKLDRFGIKINQQKIDGVRIGDAKTGQIETFPITIKQFSIGQKQLTLSTIYANDSSGQFEPDVVGLIGYDALAELNALLDLSNAQLLLPENKSDIKQWLNSANSTNYQIVDLHKSDMGFSFVDVKLGENKVRLLVDTGAPELILDESTLLQFGLELESHPTAKSVVAEGIEVPMKVLKNGRVQLADAILTGDFFTTDFTALMNAVNQANQPPLIGILGNKHLVQMHSIIDVANGKLYIKP